MAFPWIPHMLVGALAGLGSALGLGAIGSLAGLMAASGALTIVHPFAVGIMAALAMLVTTAGALLAADWRADLQSRQAWAQFEPTALEWSLLVSTEAAREIDPRYLVAVDNEAVWQVFRSHRLEPQAPVLDSTEEVSAAKWPERTIAATEPSPPQTTWDAVPKITCDHGISTAAMSRVGSIGQASGTVPRTMPAEAPIVVSSHRLSPVAYCARRAVLRTRLVGNAWSGRLAPDLCVLTRIAPEKRTAGIIVLSSSRDDQARPFPDASTGNSAASRTKPPSCRGPPRIVGHRSHAGGTARENPSAKSAKAAVASALPAADPVVRDDLAYDVPVCAAELNVIEVYLDEVLRDLLLLGSGASKQEKA